MTPEDSRSGVNSFPKVSVGRLRSVSFKLEDDDVELVLDLVESLVDVPDKMSNPKCNREG
jgi:hypothetical protein